MPNQPPSRSLPEIDLSSLNTYPICERRSKVSVEDFATPWHRSERGDLLSSLPRILAATPFAGRRRPGRGSAFAPGESSSRWVPT